MTYGELQDRMASSEFELWQALAMVKADECPNCGVEPKDMMDFEVEKFHCPTCKQESWKTRWRSSQAQAPL